jgi:hypothetical protein
MHRNSAANSTTFRWENYDNLPLSGSLIVTPSPHSPKNYNNQTKAKYDELGFKHSQFQRHESEKEFKKVENFKNMQYSFPPEQSLEEVQQRQVMEKPRNS